MILVDGYPGILVPTLTTAGITPAQISALGSQPSPLLNDVDPGDTQTRLFWRLLSPLPGSGQTLVTDNGGYALIDADPGSYSQDYKLSSMPATGAAYNGESSIDVLVGSLIAPEPGVFSMSGSSTSIAAVTPVQPASATFPMTGSLASITVPGGESAIAVWATEILDGLTALQAMALMLTRLERIEKLLRNKQVTDPATGLLTVYEDDGTTVFMQAVVYEDAGATQLYRGRGISRRERLA